MPLVLGGPLNLKQLTFDRGIGWSWKYVFRTPRGQFRLITSNVGSLRFPISRIIYFNGFYKMYLLQLPALEQPDLEYLYTKWKLINMKQAQNFHLTNFQNDWSRSWKVIPKRSFFREIKKIDFFISRKFQLILGQLSVQGKTGTRISSDIVSLRMEIKLKSYQHATCFRRSVKLETVNFW